MSKKNKPKRLSKALRYVRTVEAVMLGEDLPLPKVKVCRFTPTSIDGLCKLVSDELRAMAYDLGIYSPKVRINLLRHRDIATDVFRHLSTVSVASAPGTLDGLLELGTHRLRYLAKQLDDSVEDGSQAFLVPKRKDDLTDEEVARRVLIGLKEFDKGHYNKFAARPPRLEPQDLVPDSPEPPIPVKAKTVRLLKQKQTYLDRTGVGKGNHPGRNSPSYHPKKRHGKRTLGGHKGRRDAELLCGCQVSITISRTRYFYLDHVRRHCAAHPKGFPAGIHHVRELKKEPGRNKPPGRAPNKQTSRRSWA